MDKEKVLEKFKKILDTEPWISPNWEPWAKCAEEEKEDFVLFCNFIGQFAPKSLGAICVTFEKCNPHRAFIWYDKASGHDPNFLSKLLKDIPDE